MEQILADLWTFDLDFQESFMRKKKESSWNGNDLKPGKIIINEKYLTRQSSYSYDQGFHDSIQGNGGSQQRHSLGYIAFNFGLTRRVQGELRQHGRFGQLNQEEEEK